MALAACQSSPDLLSATLASLAPDKGQSASQANSKSLAALGKSSDSAASTCPKDFWGSCKIAANAPDKAGPASKAASPQPAPAQAAPCPKDFWGNCKAAPAEAEKEPLIKVALMTAIAPPVTDASPSPPCAKDFWGSCKLVAVKPHVYLWNYSKSDTSKANLEVPKKSEPEKKKVEPVVLNRREVPAHSNLCHPRRRVVGEERGSREDAQQAADDAWMGEVRYDFGERYQDLNKAKDVRHNCNPSTISSALKSAQFRCVVEATPCRAPLGLAEKR